MLQNRVDPSGNIICTKARGAWLGNRGVIHNEEKKIVRPFKIKAWITCVLEFRGRHREIMTPNSWTELFFLDEATTFSAGHRPCFQCRYLDHKRFKSAWIKGNPEYGMTEKTSIQEIDKILQQERIGPKGNKITYTATISKLPYGTFIEKAGEPFLLSGGKIHHWTPFGYDKSIPVTKTEKVVVLTPKSIVNTFLAGYKPQMGI